MVTTENKVIWLNFKPVEEFVDLRVVSCRATEQLALVGLRNVFFLKYNQVTV